MYCALAMASRRRFRTSTYRSVVVPASVVGLSAIGPDGPVFVVSYEGKRHNTTLSAVDLSGNLLWNRKFHGDRGTSHVSEEGTVWIAHRELGDVMLTEMDRSGATMRTVRPECAPGDRIGAFVVLPRGFCVAWLPPPSDGGTPSAPVGRVALHAPDGSHVWFTWADLGKVSYEGLMEWRADNDWVGRPIKPFTPRSIDVAHQDPLLVSGNRIAVTFDDEPRVRGSGLGVTFFLDLDTGQLIERTSPGPHGFKAIPRPGEFLVGFQGYGAFSTQHYDSTGTPVREWATHAMLVVDHNGTIRGPESENMVPGRSDFVVLEGNGRVIHGPAFTGYYTSYPAIDEHGTSAFWRDGRLVTVDANLKMRTVLSSTSSEEDHTWSSRVLLLADGLVAFSLRDYHRFDDDVEELIFVENTGLGSLDGGVWPCGDGGLHGNPVVARGATQG